MKLLNEDKFIHMKVLRLYILIFLLVSFFAYPISSSNKKPEIHSSVNVLTDNFMNCLDKLSNNKIDKFFNCLKDNHKNEFEIGEEITSAFWFKNIVPVSRLNIKIISPSEKFNRVEMLWLYDKEDYCHTNILLKEKGSWHLAVFIDGKERLHKAFTVR